MLAFGERALLQQVPNSNDRPGLPLAQLRLTVPLRPINSGPEAEAASLLVEIVLKSEVVEAVRY